MVRTLDSVAREVVRVPDEGEDSLVVRLHGEGAA
jgi:hypothetical protein